MSDGWGICAQCKHTLRTIKIARISPEPGRSSGRNKPLIFGSEEVSEWAVYHSCPQTTPGTRWTLAKSIEKYHLHLFPDPKPQTAPPSRTQMYNKYLSSSNYFRTFSCVAQVGIFIYILNYLVCLTSHTFFLQPKYREQGTSPQTTQIEKAYWAFVWTMTLHKKILLQPLLT